jgi:hypothetical protein
MSKEVEELISDPIERKVFDALANPKWDFRTIIGISKNTGLDESVVKAVLDKYSNLIRMSPISDDRGRNLYTLRTRPFTLQERLAVVQRVLSKSAR